MLVSQHHNILWRQSSSSLSRVLFGYGSTTRGWASSFISGGGTTQGGGGSSSSSDKKKNNSIINSYNNININNNSYNNNSYNKGIIIRHQSSSSSSSSSSGSTSSFRPRRMPGKDYLRSRSPTNNMKGTNKNKKMGGMIKGPKDPNDISTPIPRIDMSQIKISNIDVDDDDNDMDDGSIMRYDHGDDDDGILSTFGPLMGGTIRMLRARAAATTTTTRANGVIIPVEDDIEANLRMMDFFTSPQGSTEDLVGSRRAVALEALPGEDVSSIMEYIDRLVEEERVQYMDLPSTDHISIMDMNKEESKGSNQIPHNQLAHGDWGELLIRTDRVTKMWRGGRIESYRALVIGGNLRGCGGFGIGKAFEPEDAVEIASRMAKRNIFFVDRYRGRGLTRDLTGRQNSCKVYLRATNNGLRGNPLCREILKLFGITNVVAKAHGSRNHANVVRATFKALLTHESLEEIAMKRGLRLVNLQKAKRLRI